MVYGGTNVKPCSTKVVEQMSSHVPPKWNMFQKVSAPLVYNISHKYENKFRPKNKCDSSLKS